MNEHQGRCGVCGAEFADRTELEEHANLEHASREHAGIERTSAGAQTPTEPNDSLGTPRQVERLNRTFERRNWE